MYLCNLLQNNYIKTFLIKTQYSFNLLFELVFAKFGKGYISIDNKISKFVSNQHENQLS
jgi:hypothetical protein